MTVYVSMYGVDEGTWYFLYCVFFFIEHGGGLTIMWW